MIQFSQFWTKTSELQHQELRVYYQIPELVDIIFNGEIIMDLNHVIVIIVQLSQIEQHEQLKLIIKTIDHEIHIVVLNLFSEILIIGHEIFIMMYCGDDYEMLVRLQVWIHSGDE